MARFQRGYNFPNEGFVQKAIEEYFNYLGYSRLEEGYPDLICLCEKSGTKWIIEAKGETTSIGLDFRTGLGQLVQRMDEEANYAIAVPEIPQFVKQCSAIPERIRTCLNIHIIFVDARGNIRIVFPNEDVE